ncbi:hypothetical protein F4779DRAFT_618811 [Xylariaceae sp. FL0662B]|nr:hypothetical protein F4779DRAFT_618811 [Xylariaceae sp. FL0662B]
MASAFKENKSHYEPSSPSASVHGAGDGDGEGTSNAPERHSNESSSADHVHEKAAVATPLTKKQKFKRHCGRFWWWYLIGLIIFLAIFLPILFLVILPAIVQRILDNQAMLVTDGAFVAVSSQKLNISISTSLDTPLPADIDPVNLFMYNKNTPTFSPFVNVTLPPLHVDGDTPIVVTDQTVTITNETELVAWFGDVFDLPKVTLSTRGEAPVHLGALHSTAHIEKTVEVNSLNKLNGFAIEHMQLLLPPKPNGTNIQGTLNLPNWGALTLGIGNLSLNLMSGDVRIGLITIYDVILPRGNNLRYFNGELFLDVLLQNFGKVLASQGDALSNGNIQIDATGNATIVNGEHIKFIEAVLNKRRVSSTVPVMKLAGDLISSFTNGSDVSITDLIDEIAGNSTLIEDALSHWNITNSAATTKMKRSLPFIRPSITGPTASALVKLGAKMSIGKH